MNGSLQERIEAVWVEPDHSISVHIFGVGMQDTSASSKSVGVGHEVLLTEVGVYIFHTESDMPSHFRPVDVQLLHVGLFSSHLILRILQHHLR